MRQSSFWRLRYLPEGFLFGDEGYGNLRLLVVFLFLAFSTLLGGMAFEIENFNRAIEEWRVVLPFLEYIPRLILYPFASFFTLYGLRYMIAPLAAVVFAILVGAHYIQDIYELPDFRFGLRYLTAALFGMQYPVLKIDEGKRVLKAREINLVDVIGGPGYVKILPGNVVLFERLSGPANVRSAGRHFIPRGEMIREISSLEDQHIHTEEISATTKDGIEVVVREVHLGFRLKLGRQLRDLTDRTPADPYPFSVQAVRNRTYNGLVSDMGLVTWHDSVRSAVNGVISDYISRHKIDQLTAPRFQDNDPREEIKNNLFSKGTRERLRNLGAELLWVDIGHFEIPDKVTEQRVKTWQAKWRGIAERERAEGEALRITYLEQGRAEAQAELIMKIVKVLEDINVAGDRRNVRRLFFARTAQILDAINESSSRTGSKETEK
jgi:uncharacterized protein YnzC (UPF0291/DUF896 family)